MCFLSMRARSKQRDGDLTFLFAVTIRLQTVIVVEDSSHLRRLAVQIELGTVGL